jgi:hypothetical protein
MKVYSIRLKEELVEHIKKVARQMSSKMDRDITYLDLIRESVEMAFPYLTEPKDDPDPEGVR